jgi:hypothetical protein
LTRNLKKIYRACAGALGDEVQTNTSKQSGRVFRHAHVPSGATSFSPRVATTPVLLFLYKNAYHHTCVCSIAALRPNSTKNTRGRNKYVCRANIPPGPLSKSNCYKAREISVTRRRVFEEPLSAGPPQRFTFSLQKPQNQPDSPTAPEHPHETSPLRLSTHHSIGYSHTQNGHERWPSTLGNIPAPLTLRSSTLAMSYFHVFYILETTEFFTERRAGHGFMLSSCVLDGDEGWAGGV